MNSFRNCCEVVFFLAAAIMCFRPVFYPIVCHHSGRHKPLNRN